MSAENGTGLARQSPADIESPVTNGEIDTLFRLANGLAQSGFFKDAKQAQQAFAKLVFGRDLGLSATQAMTGINIIEGRPEMNANLQASKVKSSGRYDYRVIEHTNEKCVIEFGPSPAPGRDEQGAWLAWPEYFGTGEFSMEDAQRAGLANKANWKAYPKNMLFARAMSNGVAFHCPDVMNGIRVYAEGEIAEQPRSEQGTPGQSTEAVDVETPVDAEVVPEDRLLNDEEGEKLALVIAEAEIDDNELQMLLTSVGVDCTDDLTVKSCGELLEQIEARKEKQS